MRSIFYSNNGSRGVTFAAAYLTPKNQFGNMYISKYEYNGNGTIEKKADDVNPGAKEKWSGTYNNHSTINNKLFETASSYITGNSRIKNTIKDVTMDDIKNNRVNIQTDDGNNKFIATTLYVRYTYDINDGNNREDTLNGKPVWEDSDPVLNSNFKKGPYFAMGDFFDASINTYKNPNNKKKIINGQHKYLKSASDLGLNLQGLTFTEDERFAGGKNVSTTYATYEKRFEYRRYIETKTTTVDNPGGYEVVYPVENVNVKTRKELPDINPKISVTSNTEYTDSSKTNIKQYTFDINIEKKNSNRDYSKNKSTYTTRKASDYPSNEPRENEIDFWHSNMDAKLDIIDTAGNSRLYNAININPTTDKRKVVTLDMIKPNAYGSKSLDGCTAKVKVSYKNNARYMNKKETYTYSYLTEKDNKYISYDELIQYITSKPSGLGLTTELKKHWDSTDPRDELFFTTDTSKLLNKEANSNITAVIYGGDNAKPNVTVETNPPQTLTKLEGATFDIITKVKTPTLPILPFDPTGENPPSATQWEERWLSNFMIDEILVTAENGEVIRREESIPFNPSGPSFEVENVLRDVTANPSHIGKATVLVTYSYDLNIQKWSKSTTPTEEKIDKDSLEIIPQTGVVKNHFEIYSLTGNSEN